MRSWTEVLWLPGSANLAESGIATMAMSSISPSASSPVAAFAASSGSDSWPFRAAGVSESPSPPPVRKVGVLRPSSAVSSSSGVAGAERLTGRPRSSDVEPHQAQAVGRLFGRQDLDNRTGVRGAQFQAGVRIGADVAQPDGHVERDVAYSDLPVVGDRVYPSGRVQEAQHVARPGGHDPDVRRQLAVLRQLGAVGHDLHRGTGRDAPELGADQHALAALEADLNADPVPRGTRPTGPPGGGRRRARQWQPGEVRVDIDRLVLRHGEREDPRHVQPASTVVEERPGGVGEVVPPVGVGPDVV